MEHSRSAKGEMRAHSAEASHPSAGFGPDADVLVLGAGVVGMTTAYALARRGYSVIVADRADGPAQGSSFANGAQLSYAFTDALGQPGLIAKMPAMIAGRDPAFRVKLSLDPDFLRWGLSFLRNCTEARFAANTRTALKLGLESQAAMMALRQRHPFDFGHATPGKMHIFRNRAGLDQARRVATIKQAFGVEQHVLSPFEALAIEPALAETGAFTGALWTPGEEAGDPLRFCQGLLGVLQGEYGVRPAFGFDIATLTRRGERIIARSHAGGEITARRAIVCLGAEAPEFLAPLGLRVPIRPMKGYSFTAPAGANAPQVSITDTARKIVFCRLGNAMRVAGLAELDRRDRNIDPARLQGLIDGARASLPHAADYDAAGSGWAGLRPMTPTSRPIIRQARAGIFLNIGHGMLGWTFACGAAERVAALVEDASGTMTNLRKLN